MGASRYAEEETPKEVLRQAQRIDEQCARLGNLLTNASDWLGECRKVLGDNSPRLAAKMKDVHYAIDGFNSKSRKIYTELAAKMRDYANKTQSNIEELDSDIGTIVSAIDKL